jgi:hypothetical protein
MNLLRLCLLCFLAAGPLAAATVTITVVNSQGSVLPNAYVVVHWDPVSPSESKSTPERQNSTAATDSYGRISLELGEGVYDVFVTAAGFSPHCDKIMVKNNEQKKYQVKLKLSKFLPTVRVD